MTVPPELIAIGRIAGGYGVRGELKITPMTPSTGRFSEGLKIWIGPDDKTVRACTIRKIVVRAPRLVITVDGVDSRTEADSRKGDFLFIDSRERVTLPKRTWFISDIIGMSLIDEEAGALGVITDVLALPGHHVYVLQHNGREVLIPAIPSVVLDVDVEKRRMTVHLPEGLLEL